jgi:hypothetical protein
LQNNEMTESNCASGHFIFDEKSILRMNSAFLLQHLPDLQLSRLGEETEAGLWITSLPWPRAAEREYSLNGHITFQQRLGQWPGEAENSPRRMLLIADGQNRAPETISLASAGSGSTPKAAQAFRAEAELFAHSPHQEYVWERHLLRLKWGENSLGLAMGLKTGGKIHWWEACRLVVRQETPECLVVEMGGAIPLREMSFEEFKAGGYSNPYLHRHNWLSGHIFARLHANGVGEVFAHHINSKFFDDGSDLKDAVPVIGFHTPDGTEEIEKQGGDWDGSQTELELGKVRFDLREVTRLATPQQPGNISRADNFFVLQPYRGMELFGGACPQELKGDPFLFHAEEQIIPRGAARTLRFSFSLSDRSPRVARYLAPAWWFGACEEFLPAPLLPVSNEYDATADSGAQWISDHIQNGGFEDGSIPRNVGRPQKNGDVTHYEPGWEGEIPYALFLRAWRTGSGREYSQAMRAAYYFTDVCVDHAVNAVRMHGFLPYGFSVPMNRVQACIAAFLETGDGYLLETAQAVTTESYWTHKNSWPRMAVGRDARFIRSAVLIYRYFAIDFFRQIARDAAHDAIESQRANGSFGDQGGGAGIHSWAAYITKPWMGILATGGVLDYLELFPDDEFLLQGVKKFADWLMAERFEENGVLGWAYQHDFNGGRTHFQPSNGQHQILPGPVRWHQEGLGRLLTFCALRFGKPEYFEAWAQSYAAHPAPQNDHGVSAALQFLPWVQAQLWQATLTENGVETHPAHFPGAPESGIIFAPGGRIETTNEHE